jgi:hypothetical protein
MPAQFTKTSIRPNFLMPWSTTPCRISFGAVMFRGSQIPPSPSTCFTSSGSLEGLREVAMTLWPAFRAMSVSDSPKPDEHPVTSQTRDLFSVDILNDLDVYSIDVS